METIPAGCPAVHQLENGEAQDGEVHLGDTVEGPVFRAVADDGVGLVALLERALHEFLGEGVVLARVVLRGEKLGRGGVGVRRLRGFPG